MAEKSLRKPKKIAFAGAGFSCAVIARELAEKADYVCDVFETRNHIAGNCYSERDAKTGVMVHTYGPHIFHTSREDVWRYVNQFGEFGGFTNRVKAVTQRGVFSLPINLLTINQFFHKTFSPTEAEAFLKTLGDHRIAEPQNFEEQALKMLGAELYKNFFYGYTKKQWGVDPKELPASILKRLPVRFNYDDNYFQDSYQGIPKEGYTEIVRKILQHPRISVRLKTPFHRALLSEYDHVFYSGPLDGYFDHELGRLAYRTLRFEAFYGEARTQEKQNQAPVDFQGNAVVNYCEESVPYTRITEHKHFAPWELHDGTICFREYSDLCKPSDIPYYPLRLASDQKLLNQYVQRASAEKKVSFVGRLGTYRYLDMHVIIAEALDAAKSFLEHEMTGEAVPAFFVKP